VSFADWLYANGPRLQCNSRIAPRQIPYRLQVQRHRSLITHGRDSKLSFLAMNSVSSLFGKVNIFLWVEGTWG